MEIALIRIDPKKKGDDGRPAIVASIVVDTTLKIAEHYHPHKWGLLPLTRVKFQKRFPGRSFPSKTETADHYLLKWAQRIDPTRYEDNSPSYILTNTIVLSSDSECSKVKEILAVGDCVYVKCKHRKSVELPKPALLLESANHYIFQRYCLLTGTQFVKANKGGAYVHNTTSNYELSKLKSSIEHPEITTAGKNIQTSEPIDTKKVIGNNDFGKIVHFGTKLPSGIIQLLKDVSAKKNVPMTHILIDCILSKYGKN